MGQVVEGLALTQIAVKVKCSVFQIRQLFPYGIIILSIILSYMDGSLYVLLYVVIGK